MVALLGAVLVAACGRVSYRSEPPDARAQPDTGSIDAPDGVPLDAPGPDVYAADAPGPDTPVIDASAIDASVTDAGAVDALVRDAALGDSGAGDAGGCVPSATWPPPRSGPGIAFDETRGELVVHGGVDGGATVADTYTWSFAAGWRLRTPPTAGPSIAYTAMAFSVAEDRALLVGGCTLMGAACTDSRIDTMWGWDGTTWTLAGTVYRENYQSALGYDRAAAVTTLRGGWDYNAAGSVLDWNGTAWSGRFTTPKYAANAIAFDPNHGRMMFFGGSLDTVVIGGTFVRRAGETSWTEVVPAASPSPRREAALAADLARSRVVLFGGDDDAGRFDDTWEWDGSTWLERPTAVRPPARSRGGLVYDPARGVVLLYGGNDDSGALVDLWQWDGAAWTRLGPC